MRPRFADQLKEMGYEGDVATFRQTVAEVKRAGGTGGQPPSTTRRIDAVIAHEYEEDRHVTHEDALKAAPKTGLPITDGARRILRAMGR